MRVQDVMTNNVKTVASAVPAEDAWNIMRAARVAPGSVATVASVI